MGQVFAAIGRFFTDLLKMITDALGWFSAVFVQVFVDLWEMLTDLPIWFVDQALGVAVGAIAALPVPAWDNSAWSNLTAEALNMAGLIGLDYCLGIIGTALLIRFGLQMIPFVRWGS